MVTRTPNARHQLHKAEHPGCASEAPTQAALNLAAELATRYEITAVSSLLAAVQASMEQDEITVAVFGRFKAGKSSFLNDLIGYGPVLPVWIIKGLVCRHFARTISYVVYQNLSRLSTQWEESINSALGSVEKEAKRRLDELIGTVEKLIETSGNEQSSQLRADLEAIRAAQKLLAREHE